MKKWLQPGFWRFARWFLGFGVLLAALIIGFAAYVLSSIPVAVSWRGVEETMLEAFLLGLLFLAAPLAYLFGGFTEARSANRNRKTVGCEINEQ